MMNRFATSAAAFALLMTSVAFAQTDPATPDAAPPAPGQAAPATDMVAPISPAGEPGDDDADDLGPLDPPEAHADADDEDESAGDGRRGRGLGDRGRHSMRHPGWRMHHPGAMAVGRQGAAFRFNGGEEGPSIMIRCAGRDSTAECVEAIMPMLDKLLEQRGAPAQ